MRTITRSFLEDGEGPWESRDYIYTARHGRSHKGLRVTGPDSQTVRKDKREGFLLEKITKEWVCHLQVQGTNARHLENVREFNVTKPVHLRRAQAYKSSLKTETL